MRSRRMHYRRNNRGREREAIGLLGGTTKGRKKEKAKKNPKTFNDFEQGEEKTVRGSLLFKKGECFPVGKGWGRGGDTNK